MGSPLMSGVFCGKMLTPRIQSGQGLEEEIGG